jgi:hypothetical protein
VPSLIGDPYMVLFSAKLNTPISAETFVQATENTKGPAFVTVKGVFSVSNATNRTSKIKTQGMHAGQGITLVNSGALFLIALSVFLGGVIYKLMVRSCLWSAASKT